MTQAEPRIDRRTTLRHGEEDMAGPVFDFGAYRVAGQHILLMNLAATPEAENHSLASTCDPTCAERRVVGTEQQFANRMSTGVEG